MYICVKNLLKMQLFCTLHAVTLSCNHTLLLLLLLLNYATYIYIYMLHFN
jgi:hypothetical protein